MSGQITFSVIIPTYNRCYIVWRAILSVLNQTHPWFELLIIDDASTDDTEKLVKQFSDPRVKYFKLKKNKGPATARNFGLKKAKGKYIAYLDSDNEWHKDYLESVLNAFKRYPNKVLIFCKKNYRLEVIDEKGRLINLRDEFTGHRKYFDLKRLWQRKIIIDTNTLAHKKEIIRKIGGWDQNLDFWEDFEFTLRASRHYPKGFLYINRALVDYKQTLDFRNKLKAIKKWEAAERYIYNKHKDHPLIKEQSWYPKKSFKSTESIIKFLQEKKP
jgi:glycosyltransferase involved in cell wall biosynthesis